MRTGGADADLEELEEAGIHSYFIVGADGQDASARLKVQRLAYRLRQGFVFQALDFDFVTRRCMLSGSNGGSLL